MCIKFTPRILLIFFAGLAFSILTSGKPARALTAEVTPRNVPINILYHGAQVMPMMT